MNANPDRIQRIAAAVHECACSWEPGARLIGNVTAEEIRELAIAASQAVAPPEPVVVEWRDDPGDPNYSAEVGPLVLAVWPSRLGGWGWTVTMMDRRVAEIGARSQGLPRDAAKTAAIAAARAWRDSIRL